MTNTDGRPYAEVVDLGVRWDTGAPEPHIVSNGHRASVVCRGLNPVHGWDGTSVRVVSPSDEVVEKFIVIRFLGCVSVRMGAPNDEAMAGHPLMNRGLTYYAAHEVKNSDWLEAHITINAVHPHHNEAQWRMLRHWVLTFHDEMVEVLCRDIEAHESQGTFKELLLAETLELVNDPSGGATA